MSQLTDLDRKATLPLSAALAVTRSGERFHGLDWLRAVAALLVVALHGGLAYTLSPWPGLAWPVHDRHPSPFVDAVTWWINGFIMPLFFLLGGFVAAQLLLQRGPDEFLKHRARRLLWPLFFGCVVILPLDLYVWLLGWVVEGRIPLRKLQSLKLDGARYANLWGVAHLWFLEYLFLFSTAAWVVYRFAAWRNRRRTIQGRSGRENASMGVWETASRGVVGASAIHPHAPTLPHPHTLQPETAAPKTSSNTLLCVAQRIADSFWFPFLVSIPCAAALYWEPRIVIGFRNSWHPLPANVLYYAPCFCVGWWWLLRHRAGKDVGRNCELHVGCSLLAFAIVLPLVRRHVDVESAGWDRAAVTGLFALFAWLSATGWFGMYLKHLGPAPRAVRYLAEASFWIYLVHHPVVGLAQVALAGSSLPAVAKYAVATGAAILLSLLTCHVLVRDTRIGVLLNGRRASRIAGTQPDEQVPVLPAQAAPRRKAA